MSSLPRRRNPPVMEPPPFRVLSPLSPELPPPPRTPEPNRVFPPQVHVRRQPTTAFVILADEPETPRRSSSPFRGRGFKESKIPVAKGTLVGARSAPQSRHQSPSKIPRLRGSTPSPTPHKPDHSKKRVNARPPRPLDNHGTIGRKTKVPILDNARSKSTTSINSVHTTDVKHKNLVQQKNLKNAGFKKEKNVERFAVERNGRDSKKIFDKKTKIDPENRFVKEVKEEKEDATSAGPIKIEVAGKPEESLALESSTIINEQGKGSSLGERAESTVTIIQINNEPTTNNRSRVLENLVAARAARRVAAGLTDFKTSLQQRNAHKAALAAEAAARVAAQAAAQAAVSKTEIKPEVVPPVPAVRESIPKAVSPEVKVISNSNNPDARTSSPEVLSKVQGHIVAEIETDPARTNGGLKMNGLKSERPRPVTELLTTDLDALEEEARNSLGIIGDSEEDVSGTVSEPPEVDNQSGNRPRSKVSFKSPELRPLTSDLKQEQPGLWNKISGRVKTYCKIGPVKKKPGRKNANLLPPEKLAKIQTKPAEVKDIVKEPVKDIKIPVNNNETTDDNSNEKKDVNSVETKETDAKSKKDTKIDKDTKNVSKDSKKAAAKSVDKKTGKEEPGKKGVLGRVRARLRTCFKRKKRTGPGLLARMNCFKARKRKTINKDIKPPFWKRLSCSCCKTCARGNKAAPENNNKKPGGAKPARKTSLGGFPKLEAALVEHNSVMRGAIPVLPLPLAWICLLLNVFLPGIGTLVSGLFCLCFGKPRFSVDDTSVARFGSFCVNFLVAVSQTFTILFCLVGWGWSIWWGVLIIKLARKNRRIKQVKLVEKKTAETQESKHRDPEAGR